MSESTSLVAFTKLSQKTAALTAAAVSAKLRPLVAHTITFDNGSEFVRHEQITAALGIPVYFVDPYEFLVANPEKALHFEEVAFGSRI